MEIQESKRFSQQIRKTPWWAWYALWLRHPIRETRWWRSR